MYVCNRKQSEKLLPRTTLSLRKEWRICSLVQAPLKTRPRQESLSTILLFATYHNWTKPGKWNVRTHHLKLYLAYQSGTRIKTVGNSICCWSNPCVDCKYVKVYISKCDLYSFALYVTGSYMKEIQPHVVIMVKSNGRHTLRPNVEMNCNEYFMRHISLGAWIANAIVQLPDQRQENN